MNQSAAANEPKPVQEGDKAAKLGSKSNPDTRRKDAQAENKTENPFSLLPATETKKASPHSGGKSGIRAVKKAPGGWPVE